MWEVMLFIIGAVIFEKLRDARIVVCCLLVVDGRGGAGGRRSEVDGSLGVVAAAGAGLGFVLDDGGSLVLALDWRDL